MTDSQPGDVRQVVERLKDAIRTAYPGGCKVLSGRRVMRLPAPAPLRHTHNFDETLLDGYMRCQCGARLWEPKADASPAKETP